MTQNYGKDQQNQSKTTPSDKAKIDQDSKMNADRNKSDQMRSSPGRGADSEEAHRQGGNRVSDQGGKKPGSDRS